MAAYDISKAIEEIESKSVESDLKLVSIRGVPQNPSFDPIKFEDIINNFITKDGDVFIATFVKAGTTWTQQIIHQLLRKGESGGFYGESVPWLECCASEFLLPREAPTWTYEKINNTPAPRYFKTHATVPDLPKGNAKIKTIYVARNPKDSMVSLYHHAKSKPEFGFTGDFEKFFHLFIAGQAENGSWFSHVLDWYKKCQAEPDTHLFLKYEDMYDNPKEAVKTIAKFINVTDLDESIIDNVVKNSSLSEMRVTSSFGLNHLRQGGYGNWRSMFSVRLSEFFDDIYKHKMANSGLTFNFGPNSQGVDIIM